MSYTDAMINYVCEQYFLSDNLEDALDYLEDQIDFTRDEIREMIVLNIKHYKE
jgi:hypothetical protein